MYHAACKVEFQPFNRSYLQLTFFNFYKKGVDYSSIQSCLMIKITVMIIRTDQAWKRTTYTLSFVFLPIVLESSLTLCSRLFLRTREWNSSPSLPSRTTRLPTERGVTCAKAPLRARGRGLLEAGCSLGGKSGIKNTVIKPLNETTDRKPLEKNHGQKNTFENHGQKPLSRKDKRYFWAETETK